MVWYWSDDWEVAALIELEEPWTLAASKLTLAAPWELDADLCVLVENVSENIITMLQMINI